MYRGYFTHNVYVSRFNKWILIPLIGLNCKTISNGIENFKYRSDNVKDISNPNENFRIQLYFSKKYNRTVDLTPNINKYCNKDDICTFSVYVIPVRKLPVRELPIRELLKNRNKTVTTIREIMVVVMILWILIYLGSKMIDIEDTPRTIIKIYMLKIKETFLNKKKKGLCFLCKQPGHLQFNCPNRKRPLELNTRIKLEKQMKIFHRQN